MAANMISEPPVDRADAERVDDPGEAADFRRGDEVAARGDGVPFHDGGSDRASGASRRARREILRTDPSR